MRLGVLFCARVCVVVVVGTSFRLLTKAVERMTTVFIDCFNDLVVLLEKSKCDDASKLSTACVAFASVTLVRCAC